MLQENPKHFKEYRHPDSSEDEDEPTDTKKLTGSETKLPLCPFGINCYRKNLLHFAEFDHPLKDAPGPSTSKQVYSDAAECCPEPNTSQSGGSDTDVYDSSEENLPEKVGLKKEQSLSKRYSLMTGLTFSLSCIIFYFGV